MRCSELSVKIQTDDVEFRAKVLKNYLFQKVRLSPKKRALVPKNGPFNHI